MQPSQPTTPGTVIGNSQEELLWPAAKAVRQAKRVVRVVSFAMFYV